MPSRKDDDGTSEILLREDSASGISLLVIGEGFVTTHPLPPSGRLVIGRSGGCEIPIDVSSISRRHAVLTVGPELWIEDLGSSNGTRVRGAAIEVGKPVPFSANDVVEVGSVMLVVQKRALVARAIRVEEPVRKIERERGAPVAPEQGVIERLNRLAERVAPGKISVLLLGETGVGKEVFAERIHRLSPRADKPLVKISCASLPENLLESELFGHERGAFSGADRTKPGLLESAEGGSVFLDEIGELPLALQPKLLRVLEDRKVTRLGSVQPRTIDIRFIAATNRDLEAEVERGSFRADLYFRLSGVTLVIPPLRERTDEIPALMRVFCADAWAELGRPGEPEIDDEVMSLLLGHAWPGNVRELRNVAERAVLVAGEGPIRAEHLPLDKMRATLPPPAAEDADAAPTSANLRSGVYAYERARIIEALERSGGNQTRAAKLLGISRMTLSARMDAYGLPRPRKDKRA